MCADLLHLKNEFDELKKAEIEFIHCDIMDGHFVPNLMLPPEMVNKTRAAVDIAYDIHLMTEHPENVIQMFDIHEGDMVSVHYESTPHVQRALQTVKSKGAKAAVALNPATPIESVREILDDIDTVLLMTVNPGYAGQRLIPQCIDKIRRMRRYLDELGFDKIIIEVDGNCSFENVPKMYAAGAELFVVGSSSLFKPGVGIVNAASQLRKSLNT